MIVDKRNLFNFFYLKLTSNHSNPLRILIAIWIWMAHLKGWKYVAFISAFVGGIGLAIYPIIIYPMTHIDDYSKLQV